MRNNTVQEIKDSAENYISFNPNPDIFSEGPETAIVFYENSIRKFAILLGD